MFKLYVILPMRKTDYKRERERENIFNDIRKKSS